MKRIWAMAVMVGISIQGWAQCAMCKAAAEANVADPTTHVAEGINNGVLYLLVIPYLLVGIGGAVWYFKFRNRETQ